MLQENRYVLFLESQTFNTHIFTLILYSFWTAMGSTRLRNKTFFGLMHKWPAKLLILIHKYFLQHTRLKKNNYLVWSWSPLWVTFIDKGMPACFVIVKTQSPLDILHCIIFFVMLCIANPLDQAHHPAHSF